MTPEEQLRERRNALNEAINKQDIGTIKSILHPDFVAKAPGGQEMDGQAMIRQLEQALHRGLEFRSEIEVEAVQVSGDRANLRVRRTEAGTLRNFQQFGMFLFLSAMVLFLTVNTAVRVREWTVWRYVEVATLGAVCLLCIWRAFRLGRRKLLKVQRAQETWREVDGHWLLAEEEAG